MQHAHRLKPRRTGLKLAVALVAAGAVILVICRGQVASLVGARQTASTPSASHVLEPEVVPIDRVNPEVVPINRDVEVLDAFRGDVHPLLHGKTSLALTAHLSPVGQGRTDQIESRVSPTVFRLFTDLRVATPDKVYTEHDFSGLLMPEAVQSVGQVWELNTDVVTEILRQIHPRPSLHVESWGRRAGPDGAFALLRAVSPTHMDIVLRVHAEFDIAKNVWVTPACFWGRMIIDKKAGTVEYFRLWVPTDNYRNVHITVRESIDREVQNVRDIVHVAQMELASANRDFPDALEWSDSIDMPAAEQQLKKVFYTFEDIRWVPWDQAAAIAFDQHKPILAIVLWGALDDQSC